MPSITEIKEHIHIIEQDMYALHQDMRKPVEQAVIPYPIPIARMLQDRLDYLKRQLDNAILAEHASTTD